MGPQPIGWLAITAKHFFTFIMSLVPQWSPPLGGAVGGQRPSKTGLGGAEPWPASPGLPPGGPPGPSPPNLEQHSALFWEAKAAAGVGVQSGQTGRMGAGEGSRPCPGVLSALRIFSSAAGATGVTSAVGFFGLFVWLVFFFFLLRTIHFGLTTGVKVAGVEKPPHPPSLAPGSDI